jgi:hypothetical protein
LAVTVAKEWNASIITDRPCGESGFAGDVGLVPWAILADSPDPPEKLARRCREAIEHNAPAGEMENLIAVMQVLSSWLAIAAETAPAAKTKPAKQPWPATLPERFQAVRSLLEQLPAPVTAPELAAHFHRANKSQIAELLETLALIGQARRVPEGRYAA